MKPETVMKKILCTGALLALSACYYDPGYGGGYAAPAYGGYGYAPAYGGYGYAPAYGGYGYAPYDASAGAVFQFDESRSYRRSERHGNRPEYFHAEPHFQPHEAAAGVGGHEDAHRGGGGGGGHEGHADDRR